MSVLFPRFNEFSPLFRLADELDRAARSGPLSGSVQANTRSFTPRFDIRETKEAYELHGELPGIEQSNINIEWSDDNTLTIAGHTDHSYESSSEAPRVTDAEDGPHYRKPTVEEEGEGAKKSGDHGKALTKPDEKEVAETDENRPRFWVSERSYGSFHRSFQFPAAVDHDNVKASLKNGILEIVVSKKVKSRESRKIQIQ